ncbi:hypothetical protein DVA67_021795 [Solirubrobacter sp. CPCC 204708]|uniref:TPM domain-containing protein n=1 Tax=Solirubrobacter deserti TaxID=2282478 RepID=A0ABT4REY1_9ACTN|nr:hypothetical protein [Solirubrobacter deserti]MBE2318627.1 hypothetical protein [Solirubrobacter deserti]MDA0137085.1 hypothetical protein [Solirubrobacter deserti]
MKVAVGMLLAMLVLAAPARAEDRLDRAAEGLNASPLYVHPEVGFLLSERDRELIVSHLRAANVPFDVKVVAMPLLEADESGGEPDRLLWAIDDRLFKAPRLLIAVDQRGNFTLVKARLERDIDVPFEIEYGPSGEASLTTIVPRLRAVFQLAARADDGFSYQRDRPTEPLDPLPEDRPDDYYESDDDAPAWATLVGAGFGGLFAGLVGWCLFVFLRWLTVG